MAGIMKIPASIGKIVAGVVQFARNVRILSGYNLAIGATGTNDSIGGVSIGAQIVNATRPALSVATAQGVTRKEAALNINVASGVSELTSWDYNAAAAYPLDIIASQLKINSHQQTFQKIVNIGDWNMDFNTTVSVAHGLTYSQIIGVTGYVRNDTDSVRYPFPAFSSPLSTIELNAWRWDSANVVLERLLGGIFDNTSFDSTSYNRGVLIIEYLP